MNTFSLDQFGRSIDSPIYRNIHSPFQNGMQFDSQTDRGIIKNAKIGTAAIGSANIQDLAVTTGKILSLDADKINAGTLVVALNVGTTGTGYVLIDGENNRIIVNDGTTNRIVIGNV